MKRIGILTSGGDSPGMNAAIRAAVRGAVYHEMEIFGIRRGYEGLIDGEIQEMKVSSVSDILHRGGTILRTARSKRLMTEEGFRRAVEMLETFGIEGLIVIGGDGSFRGGAALSAHGIPVMGLPGTIDNDLAYTDFTIGFDTAVNTVLAAISNIRDTSSSHERTTVIEVMGRHCGDIALYSGLAGGAEFILIPEEENDIEEHTGLETKIVVPGYIQRGGTPTARDRMLASRMGYKAIELLREDSPSKAIGISGEEIIACPLEEAVRMEKKYDPEIRKLADILSI